MKPSPRTYADATGQPAHRSMFRRTLARRARAYSSEADPVHEYLVDQANLRGFLGAWSARDDLGLVEEDLRLEDIVAGLLQPQAPVEPRILKLVLRILQSGRVDGRRLLLIARRERALPVLDWLLEIVPDVERNEPIVELQGLLKENPPREHRWPDLRYDPARLLRHRR